MIAAFNTARVCVVGVLAALVCAPTAAAPASGTARARAITLQPLTLLKTGDLSFGTVIAGRVAGTVTVDPMTDAPIYANVTGAGGQISAARFVGAGSANQLVFIRASTAPFLITRQSGGATMTVDTLRINAALFIFGDTAVRFMPAGRTMDIRYGARLRVDANQAEGVYEGTFAVTVDYQ